MPKKEYNLKFLIPFVGMHETGKPFENGAFTQLLKTYIMKIASVKNQCLYNLKWKHK